ncbi:MAG: RHS repeat-associated core domain-containing protein [Polyangiaceae bacterium]
MGWSRRLVQFVSIVVLSCARPRPSGSLFLWALAVACVLLQGACTCITSEASPTGRRELIACVPQHPTRATTFPEGPAVETVAVGSLQGTFSVTPTGEASFLLPISIPSGRAGIEPRMALHHDSSAGDGVLGQGFSITGLSAITRCAKNLPQDGEIQSVEYVEGDKLCLDGKPLVVVSDTPASVEYRTLPDTFVKVVGHRVAGGLGADVGELPAWFEAFGPSGLVTEYGVSAASRPRGPHGATRAWLAEKTRDGRGNTMTYGYCFAEAEGHTAEFALDEIRYTSFEGASPVEGSRAVKLVYEARGAEEVRLSFSGGMALQRSLRLRAIELVGPGEALVRRVGMEYAASPVSRRTLLSRVEECAADGACRPATRFFWGQGGGGTNGESDSASGNGPFSDRATKLKGPTARGASPMLLDVDGDGLDDLLIGDTDPALTTPQNPITQWLFAHNRGPSKGGLGIFQLALSQDDIEVANPTAPADPAQIQPELGTVIDYNQDGRQDVLLHDVSGQTTTWRVLLSQPAPAAGPEGALFAVHDTGVARPFPLGALPEPPALTSARGSMHLADVDGNHVPDLIQCQHPGPTANGDPSKPEWRVHLWKPAHGGASFGFDVEGEVLEALARYRCNVDLRTVDLDRDGKTSLLVLPLSVADDGSEIAGITYQALTRMESGEWRVRETRLPVPNPGGRVLFLDVNGDGLPDAVESGFSNGGLYTYLNEGDGFDPDPTLSLGDPGYGGQDAYFHLATVLDVNGDGRQDVLLPLLADGLSGDPDEVPVWTILQANGGLLTGATFTATAANIPFEPALGEAVTLAEPHGPRIGDLNGDGASDVAIWLGGELHIFENRAHDHDVLVGVHQGSNPHDPGDAEYVPDVEIDYGHLIDASITDADIGSAGGGGGGAGGAGGSEAGEEALYLSRHDPLNDCTYPRRCAVGTRRVVSGYSVDDGGGGQRRYSVRYRDGRYHASHGFLGFGARILTDLGTAATTVDFYDNTTFDAGQQVYPFANKRARQWRVSPGLQGQPDPAKVEISLLDTTRLHVPTHDDRTYFTLTGANRLRRFQGSHSPGDPTGTLLEYVAAVESGDASGAGAALLRDTTAQIEDFDDFGNILKEKRSTAGVGLSTTVTRTFENDTERWVLGQLRSQEECSSAAMQTQCRTFGRTTTEYGEIETESVVGGGDDGAAGNDPTTKLEIAYERDRFGNIVTITATGASAKPRVSKVGWDAEGLFPTHHTNPAGHTTVLDFDVRLGVVKRITDPNGLVTEHVADSFGRLGVEKHPDGTETTFTVARTSDGGPTKNAWRVRERTATSGGADEEVELDSRGRVVQRWWFGPSPSAGAEPDTARLTQTFEYDPRTGQLARRSVPVREDASTGQDLFDLFEHDALGREVRHIAPWGAVTTTAYDGLLVKETDPLGQVTTTQNDALDRTLAVTDAGGGVTTYGYGPFGRLVRVTGPDGAVTKTRFDSLGRATKSEDPDRGVSAMTYNGFGELLTRVDALGRETTFEHDAMGRLTRRVDALDGTEELTTWTWDTAPHGLGKLHEARSPDATSTYAYDALARVETVTETIAQKASGEPAVLQGKLGYDGFGRVDRIAYPTPSDATPFVVEQRHDAHGALREVRDRNSPLVYWHLAATDSAGRIRAEEMGNAAATTERGYFVDRNRLRSIATETAAGLVQRLHYTWDARQHLASRTDDLQPKHKTERFRYDALARLSCSYFAPQEDMSAPCAWSYDYDAAGNLTYKSDVGSLDYGDSAHPHAVTWAGGSTYGYDATGHQTTRPGGMAVEYTGFDLPRKVTQAAGTWSFGYDADQRRIRKTSPTEETLYFEDLYERVTDKASGEATHRYHVRSPERVIAIVTRVPQETKIAYLHADHLGSVDAVTDETGTVIERRSYDAFGQRRNPTWGAPVPASFASSTTVGFTGHESDEDLGLVHMKGRMFDPRLGRFLTTDKLISNRFSSQAWNPYSYVGNSPLTYIDPTGWQAVPGADTPLPVGPDVPPSKFRWLNTPRIGPPEPPKDDPTDNAQIGVSAPPTDVDTTGSSPTAALSPTAPMIPVTPRLDPASRRAGDRRFWSSAARAGAFRGRAVSSSPRPMFDGARRTGGSRARPSGLSAGCIRWCRGPAARSWAARRRRRASGRRWGERPSRCRQRWWWGARRMCWWACSR